MARKKLKPDRVLCPPEDKKKPAITLTDGGATFDFKCTCGEVSEVSIWGMIYERTPKGEVIRERYEDESPNPWQCKCGKKFLFVAIPDVAYKELKE